MYAQANIKNLTIGLVMSSLVIGAFATAPHYAAAAEKKVVDLTCMQTAVDTRETAISAAFTAFSTEVSSDLATRKAALHDAWGLSDKAARSTAIKSAWTTWKAEKKEAHADLRADKKAAWATFKTTAKTTCKEKLPKEEVLEKDTAGTVAL